MRPISTKQCISKTVSMAMTRGEEIRSQLNGKYKHNQRASRARAHAHESCVYMLRVPSVVATFEFLH